MTIDNLYLNVDTKRVSWVILIGGVLVPAVESVSPVAFDHAKVPSCTIRVKVANLPATAVFGAQVTVEEGFNGANTRVFTGTVLDVNGDERGRIIECQGKSAPLDDNYHKVVVTVNGARTAKQLCEDLLDDAGIAHYHVDLPSWTPGAVVPQTLTFNTYGEAITKIAQVCGGRWYEMPNGTVRVDVRDPIPSNTAWRTYFSGRLTGVSEGYPPGVTSGRPRLRKINYTQQARDVKNQAWVRGAVLTTTQPDGSQTSTTIEEQAYAASPWVLNPDGSQAYNDVLLSNELIDEVAVAADEAVRLVEVNNRLLVKIGVEIDGDPQLHLGVTVDIEDPDYSGITGLWFLEGYRIDYAAGKYTATLTLLGGEQAGTSINVSPFATFTYQLEQEVMGDRLWFVLTLDGSGSIDPDGTIAAWSWTDNRGLITGSDPVITRRLDATGIIAPWEVTLTVTDNDGGTDSLMMPIPFTPVTTAAWIPAMFAALGAYASASPDGGVTWNDQGMTGTVAVGAKFTDGVHFGTGAFGTNNGALYLTNDYCATAPTLVHAAVAGDGAITFIGWDWRYIGVVWAATSTGRIYRSNDDGLTWLLWHDFGGTYPINNIGMPGAGGLWVFGGRGDVPATLIQCDAFIDNHWASIAIGGELLNDLAAASSACTIASAADTGTSGLGIIFKGAALPGGVSVFHTPDPNGDASAWKRATGLTAGLWDGRYLVAEGTTFHIAFGDRDVWHSSDGVAYTQTANELPAGVAPNHAVCASTYIPGLAGVFLVAAENAGKALGIYKSWDGLVTSPALRPATSFPAWPAGAQGLQIAIGAPRPPAAASTLACISRAQELYTWDGVNHWTEQWHGPAGIASCFRLSQTRAGHWLFIENAGSTGDVWHSTDGVNFTCTWTHFTVGGYNSGAQDYDIGPDGTVWLLVGGNGGTGQDRNNFDPLRIYKSTDGGATFVLVYTDAGWDWPTHFTNGCTVAGRIAAHQQDANIVVVGCRGVYFEPGSIVTINGGLTWTRRSPPQTFPVGYDVHSDDMRFAAGGRLIYLVGQTACSVWWSDDLGLTWTQGIETTAFGSPVGRGLGWWRPEWFNRNVLICDSPMYGPCSQCVRVFITRDNGIHWDLAIAGAYTPNFQAQTVEYSPLRDDIIVRGHSETATWRMVGAFGAAPYVQDIRGDLPAVTWSSTGADHCAAYPR